MNSNQTYKINSKDELFQFVITNWDQCNLFIDSYFTPSNTPFYTSVDIREALHKLAPVDNNQYPAGFNNICDKDKNHASVLMNDFFIMQDIGVDETIGLIPESHTHNLFYLDHLFALKSIIANTGRKSIIISPDEDFVRAKESLNLTSHSGHFLEIFHAMPNADGMMAITKENKEPLRFCLLNHDQSKLLPIAWEKLKTKIFPTPAMGWFQRQKNLHFELYHKVVLEFCDKFSVNPNLIEAKFKTVDQIDFLAKEGLDHLAEKFTELQKEIDYPSPKIFMKASQGTYGMGITVLESADEILSMNRKTRNKMDVGKNNLKFNQILLQEGVETIVFHDGHPAEITLYLIAGKTTGGFLRTNSLKDSLSNLNSKGMTYEKYCVCEIQQGNLKQAKIATYALVARLSTAATALETDACKKII